MTTLYDTSAGIKTYLDSLEGLHRLEQDRRAAHERGEKLKSFIILGHWITDKDGRYSRVSFALNYKAIDPLILTLGNVHEVETLFEIWPDLSIGSSMRHPAVPQPHWICPACNEGWTIENAGDCTFETGDEAFVNAWMYAKTPREFYETIRHNPKEQYILCSELHVKNSANIDLSPCKYSPELPANPSGVITINPDTPFVEGDTLFMQKRVFSHSRCSLLKTLQESRAQIDGIVRDAGFTLYTMDAIPDEYCGREDTPWYLIQLPKGTIKIGWRKRVISIDWSAYMNGIDLSELFKKEDVTKGATMIHAYGVKSATDYLKRIREATIKTV